MRYILLFLLILKTFYSYSQDLKGEYISTSEKFVIYETESYSEFDSSNIDTTQVIAVVEPTMVKLDTPLVYDNTQMELMILDFVSKKNIRVKELGKDVEQGKYHLRNNHLKVKTENYKAKGRYISSDSLLLFEMYGTTFQSETFFEPLESSSIKSKENINAQYFSNSYWILYPYTNKDSSCINLHFLDSNTVIITPNLSNHRYTSWGETLFDSYKNNLFMSIHSFKEWRYYIFHINQYTDTIIYVDHFNESDWTSHLQFFPETKEARLIRASYPCSEIHSQLKKMLIGLWQAEENIIPIGYINRYDSLIAQEYLLQFNEDESFSILKKGIAIKGDQEVPIADTIYGSWTLSETTKYIALKPENDYYKFITINLIDGEKAEFFMEIMGIDDRIISEDLVKFNKINWP